MSQGLSLDICELCMCRRHSRQSTPTIWTILTSSALKKRDQIKLADLSFDVVIQDCIESMLTTTFGLYANLSLRQNSVALVA